MRDSLAKFARIIKDYWFLITLLASVAASVFYMLLFQVSPLDAYRDIKNQRQQISFHNAVGYSFLDQGQYQLAESEFDRSLNLKSTDYTALNGRYLAELFIDLQSPAWNPSVGLAIRSHLRELRAVDEASLSHLIDKYLGDVNARVANREVAKELYEAALSLKPNYVDALFTYGWFNYSSLEKPDLKKMEELFRKLCAIDAYDYRGFHGLGYALYMQAVSERDSSRRIDLVSEAAQQSSKAMLLSINRLNVVTDFGEIARCIQPSVSLFFHERGIQILDDPVLAQMKDNVSALGAQLLTRPGFVYMNGAPQKRAWVLYQLALDYLALARSGTDSAKNLEAHDRLKNKGLQIDPPAPGSHTLDIYNDQLAILDLFLPENKVPNIENAKARSKKMH